ncbi:E3 ubiquitin-protein ligase RNF170-like [Mya arenaria]|uniref:E3 ubiquitin-protein ligase RNF170-like n=1 Tax=Mya arenaria TaxID=6604 RepID=UPI0022DF2E47|nr:E3 ubiquitin-protein ligase RNF170-like [Mya arenaria]
MASRNNRNMWIEGIGDDALLAVGGFFGMFIPLVLMVQQRQRDQQIHPENVQLAEETREEVNHQRAENQAETEDANAQTEGQQEGAPRMRPVGENHGQHDCPVCLGQAEFAIQTNCGHIFCGLCIVTYWQHGRWLGAVRCPVCRQTVTLLLVNFTQEEHNSNSADKRQIVDSIYQYNRRFSGQPRPWMDYLRDLPTLLRHLYSEFFTVGGLLFMFRLRIVVCFLMALLYFLSPFDIIPEAVFGIFGFLDDLFILLLLAIYVSMIYRNVVRDRATGAQ